LTTGTAPTNFERVLAPGASDQVQQLAKDPYVFDSLTIEPGYAERELEQSLVDKIQHTFSELGAGFSFGSATLARRLSAFGSHFRDRLHQGVRSSALRLGDHDLVDARFTATPET
jgi:predicted nuclease of restriction endonuclease-like (RecB) superfamily